MKYQLESGLLDSKLAYLYGNAAVEKQKVRYLTVLEQYRETFPQGAEPELFSAPGRTEIGGNHTDHQHGCVVAASVDMDCIAAAAKNEDGVVRLLSEGYPLIVVDLSDLSIKEEEKNQSAALIRGVAAALQERGYCFGGFDAYMTSDVLQGSGLSSSAAFEVMLGTIFNYLYNNGDISSTVVAQMGQFAENIYFGKPSGLLDQMACSVGGYVAMDFYDPSTPRVEQIDFDFSKSGYTMCIVDSNSSHAELTGEYTAVPREMKAVAAAFGKEVLRQIPAHEFYGKMAELRKQLGDRAVLRACHFYDENLRAQQIAHALKCNDFPQFLHLSKESGYSSYMYLQNVYSSQDVQQQGVSLALCNAQRLLGGRGSFRVHGGGFAGTIQCFVPNEMVPDFKERMEALCGEGTCHLMRIRPVGAVKL